MWANGASLSSSLRVQEETHQNSVTLLVTGIMYLRNCVQGARKGSLCHRRTSRFWNNSPFPLLGKQQINTTGPHKSTLSNSHYGRLGSPELKFCAMWHPGPVISPHFILSFLHHIPTSYGERCQLGGNTGSSHCISNAFFL